MASLSKKILLLGGVVTGLILVVGVSIALIAQVNVSQKHWNDCVGKKLSECRIPKGFDIPSLPCPEFLECYTSPPGVRYAYSVDKEAKATAWASTSYAVIALDDQERVLAVEMKRRYAAP